MKGERGSIRCELKAQKTKASRSCLPVGGTKFKFSVLFQRARKCKIYTWLAD